MEAGSFDGEHRLVHGETALASALVNVRGIMKFIRHRIV
jgi:hypothetical protein